MALKTTLEQLEEVEAAISAVLAGKSYSIDGRSVTREDLDALSKREEILRERYQREQNPGPRVNVGIPKRLY